MLFSELRQPHAYFSFHYLSNKCILSFENILVIRFQPKFDKAIIKISMTNKSLRISVSTLILKW